MQVSWIIPDKGIDDFLQTARLVTARDRNVQFVMVGDGKHLDSYKKVANEMGLGDRITWTGFWPPFCCAGASAGRRGR